MSEQPLRDARPVAEIESTGFVCGPCRAPLRVVLLEEAGGRLRDAPRVIWACRKCRQFYEVDDILER